MKHEWLVIGLAAVGTWGSFCKDALATKTLYADEGLTYKGAGHCASGTLPNLVSDVGQMVNDMKSDGYSGNYFSGLAAWPQDFREACSTTYGSGGVDSYYADANAVSIFSGHGSASSVTFSDPHLGACQHNLGTNGRLGSMSGSGSVVGIYSSCDTLAESALPSGANNNWERENLGFKGLVDNGIGFLYSYFYSLSTEGNGSAWMDVFGGNSIFATTEPAIAVAYGTSGTDCWNTYNKVSLRSNTLMTPRSAGPACDGGQPAFFYCYNTIN